MFQRDYTPDPQAAKKDYAFIKLSLQFDVDPLVDEIERAGVDWLSGQWKWHVKTSLCILRGGKEGRHPGSSLVTGVREDAPVLGKLPKIREILNTAFPEVGVLAWIGLSPAKSCIFLHVDNTPHWDRHHRIHIPLVTNKDAYLCAEDKFVHLSKGSCWAFNNSIVHGAINRGDAARLHLIIDLPDVEKIHTFLKSGTLISGDAKPDLLAELSQDPLAALSEEQREDSELMARFSLQ